MAEDRPPRPTLREAERGLYRVTRGWLHDDPAETCRVADRHFTHSGALSCEHNSQLIAWKRARRALVTPADPRPSQVATSDGRSIVRVTGGQP